ncbi:cyclopropane-fatty-acyl-phospholipid synthase family protein [Streptomyces sp. MNP-20]|uniref:SAM-dependent methyltransferase n=1 Tax=Streptomyces sp. MNP-20 TaxID=2721165 RepID=UPI0015554DF0|nr:methyltransferase domain-containing protein [Streptomyces sp. MNP-20]
MSFDQARTPLRNAHEQEAFDYYNNKRNDAINLDLGRLDGLYHHHFALGNFNPRILDAPPEEREAKIAAELHRMETEQVGALTETLGILPPESRILDAGSGRGGTAFLLHQAYGCRVDGVNLSAYQNDFARSLATERGCVGQVRFHDRSMSDTGFPDATFQAVVSNETTMYVDIEETFNEFARLLVPGGRYVLLSWCINDAEATESTEVSVIDTHYHCHTHHRSTYLKSLLDAGLVPFQVDDLTQPAIPYWKLRKLSALATGIEELYLDGYSSDRINYIRIVSRKSA